MTAPRELSRWYALRPHREQRRLWESAARFRVAACGRRSGKTELSKRAGVAKAIGPQRFADARYIFGGPTWEQGRRIFWSDLKALTPRWALLGQDPRRAISESELSIRLASGATIQVLGLDRPQRAEGTPIDWVVVDEAADCREEVWTEHLRPGLSERGGEAWIVSTPEGRNWFWSLSQRAQEDQSGLWSFFSWTSATVLDSAEIAIAQSELDRRTFEQEYCASFLDATGRVYYGFQRELHAAEPLVYNPNLPLILCFDFNVSPGVCAIAQEQAYKGSNPAVDATKPVTCVVGEIYIPTDSNTGRICQEILERYGSHPSDVVCYGDATGGARGTAKVEGSDWTIVRGYLEPAFGSKMLTAACGAKVIHTPSRFEIRIPSANPRERVRVNAVNSRLQSADGKVHLLVDPRCVHVIRDFEGVTYREGTSEIDKKSSPTLTHLTDAIGYYVSMEFPVDANLFEVTQF